MNRRLLFTFFLVIIIAFLFWSSSLLQNEFWRIVEFFNALVVRNEPLAIVLFIFSATLAAFISPLTNIPLVPFAVVIWGAALTTSFLLVGWLSGSILTYLVGRYFGRRVVSRLVSVDRFEQWSLSIKEHTTFPTALFLRLALPAELGYAFGLVRYPFGLYVIITFLSELPFAVISTYASEAVLQNDTLQFLEFAGLLLVLVVITLIVKNNHYKRPVL